MRETRLWLLFLGTGLLMLVLLGAHFALMHYSPLFTGQSVEAVRSFEVMLERGRQTAQLVVYLLFLAAALYHGLYGLRGVILELPLARSSGRLVSGALVVFGVLFLAYGSYVTYWTFIQ